jgi:hypothetical protein
MAIQTNVPIGMIGSLLARKILWVNRIMNQQDSEIFALNDQMLLSAGK